MCSHIEELAEPCGTIDPEPQDLIPFKAGSYRLQQFQAWMSRQTRRPNTLNKGPKSMKYFVTAVLALALAGAAASAQADTPPDNHDHKDAHADHAKAPPKKADDAANKQRTLDRDDANLHSKEKSIYKKDDALHGKEKALDNKDASLHNEQNRIDHEKSALGHSYESHGLRANDHGRPVFSVNVYRPEFFATRRFHLDGYGYPGGWYAHTWGYGDVLPSGWYEPRFYLNFGLYGLLAPPIGAEWVRQGPDAVLVDVWTGQVLSVERGVFY
jgi:Ni/Co efflux regulator RcnB